MTNVLLDRIKKPSDVHQFSYQELARLAKECRDHIIDVTSQKGGHLASSLGTVELTLALAYVFDLKKDKVVWDVGHQAYTYKIITGRKEQLYTIGDRNGISKFLSRHESKYDYFGAGHASTSISAALGLAVGDKLNKEKGYHIAVIGDGGLTGGLAFEALNHAGQLDENLIVILNDNQMSITPITGGLAKTFNSLTGSVSLNLLRTEMMKYARKKHFPTKLKGVLHRFNDSFLAFFSKGVWFEKLNFKYFGQIDGHNTESLISTLKMCKKLKGPVLLHVNTIKGKGFTPAEQDSLRYHGVGKFNPESGILEKRQDSYTTQVSSFFFESMAKNKKLMVISAAMLANTELLDLKNKYPNRVFDVGIAESHAVVFSAGLSAAGAKAYVVIYSTFLQRAFDQILHDVALQNLPVVFLLDRAGFVGQDGATHQGLFDISYLRTLPNMVILSPQDTEELDLMLKYSETHNTSPLAIRFPKSKAVPALTDTCPPLVFSKAQVLQTGTEAVFFAEGRMVQKALQIATMLAEKHISIEVVNLRFLKPLDKASISQSVQKTSCWISLEENQLAGGIGSAICELLQQEQIYKPYLHCAVADSFTQHASIEEQEEITGLDVPSLYTKIENFLQNVI